MSSFQENFDRNIEFKNKIINLIRKIYLDDIKEGNPRIYLSSTIFNVITSDDLVELRPTLKSVAEVGVNKETGKFVIKLNKNLVDKKEIKDIFTLISHEVLHIVLSHFNTNIMNENRKLANIATDLAINQFLDQTVINKYNGITLNKVKNYFKNNSLKPFMSAEYYFNELKNNPQFKYSSKLKNTSELNDSFQSNQKSKQQDEKNKLPSNFRNNADLAENDLDNYQKEIIKSPSLEDVLNTIDTHDWPDNYFDEKIMFKIKEILNLSKKLSDSVCKENKNNYFSFLYDSYNERTIHWEKVLKKLIYNFYVSIVRKRFKKQKKSPLIPRRSIKKRCKISIVIDVSESCHNFLNSEINNVISIISFYDSFFGLNSNAGIDFYAIDTSLNYLGKFGKNNIHKLQLPKGKLTNFTDLKKLKDKNELIIFITDTNGEFPQEILENLIIVCTEPTASHYVPQYLLDKIVYYDDAKITTS